jgi:hypothetical protein
MTKTHEFQQQESLNALRLEKLQAHLREYINDNPRSREEIENSDGQVWNTQELARDFTILTFAAPLVIVRTKSSQKLGSLLFQHHPRLYWDYKPHHD